MAAASHANELLNVVALLGAGVIAVPIFRRLGLGSVLGCFAAGLAIGPFGLKLFKHPESILQIAEFGVIMLLFIIGLEMHPSRLWQARGCAIQPVALISRFSLSSPNTCVPAAYGYLNPKPPQLGSGNTR